MTVHLRMHTKKQGMVAGVYPESFRFPGGEWHLRNLPELPTDEGQVTLIADMRGADADDLIKVALWADVAHRGNLSPARIDPKFVVMLPYMPAARADRGTPMGVSVYARLIRSLNADRIITIDPHSEQVRQSYSLASLRIAEHDSLIAQAFEDIPFSGIIAPDAGAAERATSAGNYMDLPVHYASKRRDFETGRLGDFEAPQGLSPNGRYLIVDDICDGGGTFKGLAKVLQDKWGLDRDHLALWTTHGIYSGKADELRSSYRWIATTDSHPGSRRVGVATCIVPCFNNMLGEL